MGCYEDLHKRKGCITKGYSLTVGRNEPNLNIMWEITVHSKMFKMFTIFFHSISPACEAAYYSRLSHQRMIFRLKMRKADK